MIPTCEIREGCVLDRLAELPEASVQTCVSSPPYWGLRDYKIEPTAWPEVTFVPVAGLPSVTIPAMSCVLGLETEPWAFVGHIVHVYRLIRRALREDGTAWVNLGDSYSSNAGGYDETGSRGATSLPSISAGTKAAVVQNRKRVPASGLKAKDLCGIPWRVAFALQADGWWLRSDIIWHKPNPMPESTTDRPTKAHEYIFLISKSARYYYDAVAIKEAASLDTNPRRAGNGKIKMPDGWDTGTGGHGSFHREGREAGKTSWKGSSFNKGETAEHQLFRSQSNESRKLAEPGSGTKNNSAFDAAMAVMPDARNKRSVWTMATQAFPEAHFATFPEAHFATFPEELPKTCILAGSKPGDTVLDPFGGSGTTGKVALELGRSAILIEKSEPYAAMARRRCHVTPGFVFGSEVGA